MSGLFQWIKITYFFNMDLIREKIIMILITVLLDCGQPPWKPGIMLDELELELTAH